ncbi:triose-phosphate isomerase [Lichenicola cladoniae]|nr:triose-phosphate isomerase [Lichenicola cladoniae]
MPGTPDNGEIPMRPLIAGNWKMHGMAAQLREIEAMSKTVHAARTAADVLICVPAALLSRAASIAAGRIGIGGEDCHAQASGAYTGDCSADMLKDAGATTMNAGHSDRRKYHGETDAMVAAKAEPARRAGLTTIICIGETQAQRDGGNALAVCGQQIAGSVPTDLARSGTIAIAYEPLSAIGSGHVPAPGQIIEVHRKIRECLLERAGAAGADIRILYGGSVWSDNVHDILGLADVDGVLIGGASLLA